MREMSHDLIDELGAKPKATGTMPSFDGSSMTVARRMSPVLSGRKSRRSARDRAEAEGALGCEHSLIELVAYMPIGKCL